jgi:hypothetical protein
MEYCAKNRYIEGINLCVRIIEYIESEPPNSGSSESESSESEYTDPQKSKIYEFIRKYGCVNLSKFPKWYRREIGDVFVLPDGMKLAGYLRSLGLELCRDPSNDKVVYVKINDGTEFVVPTDSVSDIVGPTVDDPQRTKVIETIRQMIQKSENGQVGLYSVMKNYAELHGTPLVLQTKLSKYLKTFDELELFTRGGIYTDMLVKFKTCSVEGGASK